MNTGKLANPVPLRKIQKALPSAQCLGKKQTNCLQQKRQRGQTTKQTNNSPLSPLRDNNRLDTASAVTAWPAAAVHLPSLPHLAGDSVSPPPPSPLSLSPFCPFLCVTLPVSLSWGLAMCVCFVPVSVLLLLSLDVVLCLRPSLFSLHPSSAY